MHLKIRKTHPLAIIPTRAKPGDSGLDLHAALLPREHVYLGPGASVRIPTGIAIELMAPFNLEAPFFGGRLSLGFEAQIRPRSGMAAKLGVVAALGTIDNGYRGELQVVLFNHSGQAHRVQHGDRIAQLVIAPVVYPEVIVVDELAETERGASGFGSTGV